MIVDVHAHYLPASYRPMLATLTARSRTPVTSPASSVLEERKTFAAMTDEPGMINQRIDMMDDAGVERQVLSAAGLAPYATEYQVAVEAAHTLNDSYCELTNSRPGRFSSFVSLPLPHIDASLEEMRRGLDELGMVGVTFSCSVFNRSTAEEEFEPLYEEMNARGTTLFFHPAQNGICSPFINDYGFTAAAGASLEDTAIVLHLIKRNIPVRYPNIKIIIPHLGGMIPVQLARLDGQASTPDLLSPPSAMARRLYYDTVGWGSQAALRCACEAFGADHVVPGSDFPILLSVESYKRTFEYIKESRLPGQEIEKILHRNAPALFDFDKAPPRTVAPGLEADRPADGPPSRELDGHARPPPEPDLMRSLARSLQRCKIAVCWPRRLDGIFINDDRKTHDLSETGGASPGHATAEAGHRRIGTGRRDRDRAGRLFERRRCNGSRFSAEPVVHHDRIMLGEGDQADVLGLARRLQPGRE